MSQRLGLGRYVREMVVVVLSILIAFGVDAWWDGVQASREEKELLGELQRDFANSLEMLDDRWIPIHRVTLIATLDLLWLVHGGQEPLPLDPATVLTGNLDFVFDLAEAPFSTTPTTITVADSLVASALFDATYDPTLASLDALLQSGSLDKFQNRDLRAALAGFPAILADSGDEERRARNLATDHLRPALRAAGNITLSEIVGWSFSSAALDDPRGWSPEIRNHRVELRVTSEIANILASRARLQEDILISLADLRERMEEILALIEAELGDS